MTGIPPRGAGYRGGTTPRDTRPVPPAGPGGVGTQRKVVYVTSAQVHAARLMVRRMERRGETPSASVVKIANATTEAPR